jgi:hypothetical protein
VRGAIDVEGAAGGWLGDGDKSGSVSEGLGACDGPIDEGLGGALRSICACDEEVGIARVGDGLASCRIGDSEAGDAGNAKSPNCVGEDDGGIVGREWQACEAATRAEAAGAACPPRGPRPCKGAL